jgi:hypothetical protein
MSSLRRFHLFLCAAPLLAACDNGPAASPTPLPVSQDGLQAPAQPSVRPLDAAFRAAAAAFEVPVSLLQAVSYTETRWSMIPGAVSEFESEAPAWGVMALRGERLSRGARLAGLPEELVRTDALANIKAAAALLRADADELGIDADVRRVDLGAWAPAVARFTSAPGREGQLHYVHLGVYKVLREGISDEEQVDKGVRFVAVPDATPAMEGMPSLPDIQGVIGYSGAKWLPAPSSNFTNGRSASIQWLVIHTCAGAYSGCLSWLRTPYPTNPNKTSAHYVINESGSEIAQIVDEEDTAHHVGASWMGLSTNPRSVGIEHGGFSYEGTNKWTEGQIAASAKLSCDIVKRNRIIQDRNHIIGHNQPDPARRANDPGREFPWTDYMNRISTCTGGGPAPTGEIVVDTNQSNNGMSARVDVSKLSADWKASTNVAGYYGSGYYAAPTASVADSFDFEFNLAAAGEREVFAWWTAASDRSTTTPFVIFNAAGTKLGTSNQNQSVNGGKWVSLGRYSFTAGWNKVSISRWTGAGKQVIADAIKVQ